MNLPQIIIILFAGISLRVATHAQNTHQYTYQQPDSMAVSNDDPKRAAAHPNARNLLNEEFYWSSVEETGPFGNDAGSDAYYGLKEWKKEHPAGNPKDYLQELLAGWNIPLLDLEETAPEKMEQYVAAQANDTAFNGMTEQLKRTMKEAGNNVDEKQFNEMMVHVKKNMGFTYFSEINEAVIAVGFGQFVIDGWINNDLRQLTAKAIKRQLLPLATDQFETDYRAVRLVQLNKMLKAVEEMNGSR